MEKLPPRGDVDVDFFGDIVVLTIDREDDILSTEENVERFERVEDEVVEDEVVWIREEEYLSIEEDVERFERVEDKPVGMRRRW